MADVLHELVMVVHMLAIGCQTDGVFRVIIHPSKVNVVLPKVVCCATFFGEVACARFAVVMVSATAWSSFFRY